MSFNIGIYGHVVVVRWVAPAVEDLTRIRNAVAEVRVNENRDVVYTSIVPDDSALPEPDVRKAFSDTMQELVGMCESVHLVLEGSGLRRATFRSIAAGIFILTGNRKMHMSDSLKTAFEKASFGPEFAGSLLTKAARDGLIKAEEAR